YLRVPVSSSQAIVGAIIGMNIATHNSVNWSVMSKLVLAWVGTPLGGIFLGFVSYKISIIYFKKLKSPLLQDRVLKILAIAFGCYGSYALGANNVANITGVFTNHLGTSNCALIGGFAIATGVLTFSKRVMYSVGKEIANLDYFSSTMVVFAESLTVWIYAIVGIPVSTSQAVVGAVLGTSIAAGNAQISKKQVLKIVIAWINTPISAGIIAIALTLLLRLFNFYV
ncbi:MAG: anion permease, partial [Bacteroidota bacterium]